jgi:cystathionine beta-lyase/cystathionine gamma-synthase
LRKKLAGLDGADDALVFASGAAAMAAAVMSCARRPATTWFASDKPYSWTNFLLSNYLSRYGVSVSMVDGRDTALIEKEIRPNTKLIVLESPNTFTFELQDLRAVAAIAQKRKISTILDNSYCTPLNQRPMEFGIDLVVYSGSKYFGGHSDIVAGVVCGSASRIRTIMNEEFMGLGGIVSPHDAWLMLRGLRTLELRVNRSSSSALQVVNHLEKHPKITKVFYPFAPSNPQLHLAKKQMKQGGGLLSLLVKAESVEQVEKFCDSLQCFLMAVSWGGHESLIFPACAAKNSSLPWNLVRLYIGLENPETLIKDIDQGLDRI